jgi:D-xylose transport system substrate-binding protein
VSGKVCSSLSSSIVRLAMACVLAGASTAACAAANSDGGSQRSSPPSPIATPSTPQACVVGVSWFNESEGDIPDWEQPALQKAVLDAGAVFLEKNDKSFVPGQGDDIDALVAAGAKVIVVQRGMGSDVLPAVQRAINAGIPVIATSQAIEHAGTLYVAYDPVEVGRQEARALLAAKPKGSYLIIKDHYSPLPDGDLIAAGILETLQPAVDRGDIKIVTVDWGTHDDESLELHAFLSQNSDGVDAVAVVSEASSRTVFWVQQTLAEANLSGKVAVAGLSSGWDSFRGIVDGTLVVDVWANPERFGTVTGQVAIALCHDPDITRVAGSATLTWPGHDPLTAVLLPPTAITKDNLSVVIQTNTRWRQVVCNTDGGVHAPPACQVAPGSTESAAAQS